mmetsp:Transcript_5969/g.11370  ORF Transcript_5969/g.11370 Transcript_5969/m.11370 type:complete len:183 (+) Transcript_5969:2-550(+)
MAGKGIGEVLLSTLFRLSELRPHRNTSFSFEGVPEKPVELQANIPLKDCVRKIYEDRKDLYKEFWCPETCERFLKRLSEVGDVGWLGRRESLTSRMFMRFFAEYVEDVKTQVSQDGIPRSWFHFYEMLRAGGHSIVINSFGMDTRRVVLRSVHDERRVVQVTINFQQWGDRDQKAYKETYAP